ncbi:hypothetical protein [Lihuaxuella thermophila]|uniref:Uncharacterized protein n=1 Tax=Lihuaxuella thermophila TaxID=1173111 RepID=A0A1H8IIG5_9BACL|nr:hypothetical protein [Lihuaxuella thermophila]SEN68630.1 hypothetical protein SAMN05444955_1182 [Lihuaxuella thermophila]
MPIISTVKTKLSDTIVLTGRSMRHSLNIDTILTATATPLMMLFMFVYVFGGAIDTGSVKNIDFISLRARKPLASAMGMRASVRRGRGWFSPSRKPDHLLLFLFPQLDTLCMSNECL